MKSKNQRTFEKACIYWVFLKSTKKQRNASELKYKFMDHITVTGFLAAFLTTTAFLPQTIKAIKTGQTKDISLLMYVILAIGILLWMLYGIYKTDWPIILANAITFLFVLPVLFLKIKETKNLK